MDKPAEDVLISRDKIETKIRELAKEIAKEYAGKNLVILAVLNGSVVLAADLLRALWKEGLIDIVFDTVAIRSYTQGTQATQEPKLLKNTTLDLSDRHILVVEDIIDTGLTLTALVKHLRSKNPKTLRLFTLLSKPSRRKVALEADYTGFVIDDLWVEGYGLDTNGKFRGSPDILYRKTS